MTDCQSLKIATKLYIDLPHLDLVERTQLFVAALGGRCGQCRQGLVVLEAVEHAALCRGVVHEAEAAKNSTLESIFSLGVYQPASRTPLDHRPCPTCLPFVVIGDARAVLAAHQSIECLAVPAVRVLFSAAVKVLLAQDAVAVQIGRRPLFVVSVSA